MRRSLNGQQKMRGAIGVRVIAKTRVICCVPKQKADRIPFGDRDAVSLSNQLASNPLALIGWLNGNRREVDRWNGRAKQTDLVRRKEHMPNKMSIDLGHQ